MRDEPENYIKFTLNMQTDEYWQQQTTWTNRPALRQSKHESPQPAPFFL